MESRANRSYAKSKGCIPPLHLRNSLLLPFGLDKLKNVLKADGAGRLPPFMLEEFERHGNTYAQNGGGQYVIITREPENIKALLSSQNQGLLIAKIFAAVQLMKVAEFELGADRVGNFSALAPDSIFTHEGHAWAISRGLLRYAIPF
jgi:hypothetical protein